MHAFGVLFYFIGNYWPVKKKNEGLYKIWFIREFADVYRCNKAISYFSCRRMKENKISKDSSFCLILVEKIEITYQRIKELRAGNTECVHDRIVISIFISNFL